MAGVFIIGFPRTATSGIYMAICKNIKKVFPYKKCIYEPFNHEVVNDILIRGRHVHDRVGTIVHDYNILPQNVRKMIYDNSLWNLDWNKPNPRHPFLGKEAFKILDLFKDDVLKDIYAWVILPKLVSRFNKTLFIVTVRNSNYVLNSFKNWYNARTLKVAIKAMFSIEGIRHPRAMLKSRLKLLKTISKRHMIGLGHFYRYFYGEKIPPYSGESLLEFYFYAVYMKYLELVMRVNAKENVYVVLFENKLREEELSKIVKISIDWIKSNE